jgi:hypothetical protein
MSPARLSNYGPGRGPRARPLGRPGTARNSNGSGRPEIQTIRAFSGLGRAGPGDPNVHLYSSLSPLSSFRPKRCGPCSLWYTVAVVTQIQLSRSRKTLAPLSTITTARARVEWLCGFSKLTQLTRIHLEQALKRSN